MCIDEGDSVLVVITVATQTSQPNSLLREFQLRPNRIVTRWSYRVRQKVAPPARIFLAVFSGLA